MNEYGCEIWIARKYTFNVHAENIEEALKKAKQIGAERKDEGEEVVKCHIGGIVDD